jgi:MarR family transcriptional regulator, transcriptional regulator for hemolysin
MALPNDALPVNPPSWMSAVEDETTRPSATALQPGVGAAVHGVARLIRRRFERSVRQAGLPITRLQAALLLYIARHPGCGQTAAATDLDIEPIALVRMLDRLHEEALVERGAHPTDRRVRTLWLTALGWQVVDRILAINRVIREEACAGLTPAARDLLMNALGRMKGNLASAEEADSAAAAELARAAG